LRICGRIRRSINSITRSCSSRRDCSRSSGTGNYRNCKIADVCEICEFLEDAEPEAFPDPATQEIADACEVYEIAAEAEEALATELEVIPAEKNTRHLPAGELTIVAEPSEPAFYRVNANSGLFNNSSSQSVNEIAVFDENSQNQPSVQTAYLFLDTRMR
jgi:hypothetical protein